MERRLIAIIFYTLMLLTACKDKEWIPENMIELNPHNAIKSIQLSEMADSVSYIKLETNENCIMGGRINRIIIKKNTYML